MRARRPPSSRSGACRCTLGPERHRPARVEDEIDGEVFFFLVQADEKAPEPLVNVPVEVAEIIAGLVLTVIRELDATPALLRSPLGPEPAREDTAAHEREVLELALKFRRRRDLVGELDDPLLATKEEPPGRQDAQSGRGAHGATSTMSVLWHRRRQSQLVAAESLSAVVSGMVLRMESMT